MNYALEKLSQDQLREIAQADLPMELAHRTLEGALPPPFVASRSLAQLSAGKPELWCGTFVVVRQTDKQIVGGCRFKDVPHNDRVEISYGMSPAWRRQGAATAAIRALVDLAFAHGVSEVLAEIVPGNGASAGSVQKLGFKPIGSRVAEDNETVIQWVTTRLPSSEDQQSTLGVKVR